jgi:tetratricopeptide (TPR) repeat protein
MRLAIVLLSLVLNLAPAGAAKPPELRSGKALYQAGKYDAALAKLRAALQKAPRRADAHYLLGLTLLKLRRFAEAERALAEARRLDPSVGFTALSKFEKKLRQAQRGAAAERAAAPASAPPAPMAGAPVPEAPAAAAPVQTVSPTPRAAEPARPLSASEGAPLWALILLGLCGSFLALSFVRGLVVRTR